MDFEADYKRRERDLADIHQRIRQAVLFRKLRGSDEWQEVERWLLEQLAGKQARLLAEELDLTGFRELRAEMKILNQLLTVGRVSDEQVAKWQADATRLQKSLTHRHNIGLDRNPVIPEGQPT